MDVLLVRYKTEDRSTGGLGRAGRAAKSFGNQKGTKYLMDWCGVCENGGVGGLLFVLDWRWKGVSGV